MQAQDYPGALWSLGLRIPNATVATVEQALDSGEIIRTWPMRGTLHFVPAVDARWMLKLMAPKVIAAGASRDRALGLNEDIYQRSFDLFRKALAGGKQLQRKEMMELLEAHNIATDGQRGYHILWRACQEALLCLGPLHGKQQSYVLLDEWVTEQRDLTREESVVEIARRFFTSHGPATLKDFTRWTKLTVKDAQYALEVLHSELRAEVVDGTTYWMAPASLALSDPAARQAYLLPGFDEYMLGYGDRSLVVEDDHHNRIVPGSNGMFMPTIVIDGRIVGIWKRTIKAKQVVITLDPFVPLSKADLSLIDQAAERYGAYLGLPASLSMK